MKLSFPFYLWILGELGYAHVIYEALRILQLDIPEGAEMLDIRERQSEQKGKNEHQGFGLCLFSEFTQPLIL